MSTDGSGQDSHLLMSPLGQKQTFAAHKPMSALPPKAGIQRAERHVRFVPKADIRGKDTLRRSELRGPVRLLRRRL